MAFVAVILAVAARPAARVLTAVSLAVLTISAAAPAALSLPAHPGTQEIPPLEELERRLFEAVNKERVSRGLPALRPNPALAELARKQSGEMAAHGFFEHVSAGGRTYTERLVEAGIHFAANAENVAKSGSFDPDLIHEALMNSPGHREAILDPELDEAGMAIARGTDGAYYVTQDFIKSAVLADEAEVRARILGALAARSAREGKPPPRPDDDIHRTAQAFAAEKAAGRDLPAVPEAFGPAAVRLFTGGDLDRLLAKVGEIEAERFRFAGAGSVFGRTPEHPGGVYVVCVLLLAGNPALEMSAAERRQAVLGALNELRAARGRAPLELDGTLSRQADELNRRRNQKGVLRPPRGPYFSAWFYETADLGLIPDGVRKASGERDLRKAGISVMPLKSEKSFSVKFSVAVLFDH
jgi:uncharacterized protein YkwD